MRKLLLTLSAVGAATAVVSCLRRKRAEVDMAGHAMMAHTPEGYVTNAGISDLYQISAAEIVMERSESAETRTLAAQMKTDHAGARERLAEVVRSLGHDHEIPETLDSRREAMLHALRFVETDSFDRTYLEQQVTAHENAIDLHGSFARSGEAAALTAHAREAVPKLERHLEAVRERLANTDAGGRDE